MSIPIAGPSKDASKALPALQLEKDPDRPTSKQLTALFKDYKPEYDTAAYRPGVERCRISCKQTEAQRLAKQEPDCSGYCYLSYGKGFREAVKSARRQALQRQPKELTEEEQIAHDRYWFSPLEGKYIIWFKGKKNYHNHIEFMSIPSELMVLCYQVQQEKWSQLTNLVKQENRQLRLQGVKQKYSMANQNMGIISLADDTQSYLQRFRAHNIRIFSPGLNNIAKIPTFYTDGTYNRMIGQVWDAVREGKAFELAGRMLDSTRTVVGQYLDNRKDGSGSGRGGFGPPGPPSGAGGAV